jgi:hypothetical protein
MAHLAYRPGIRNRLAPLRRLRTIHNGWIVVQRADSVRRIIPVYRKCVFPIARPRGAQ